MHNLLLIIVSVDIKKKRKEKNIGGNGAQRMACYLVQYQWILSRLRGRYTTDNVLLILYSVSAKSKSRLLYE